MNKKFKKLLIASIALIGFVRPANAATLAVGSDTTTPGALNKSVALELKDDDLSDYTQVTFQLTTTDVSPDYVTIDFSYKATGLAFTPNGVTYTIGNGTDPLFATTLGSISYKTTEQLDRTFKITPTNVKFLRNDGAEMKPGDSGIKIQEGTIKYEKIKSKEAALSNITVSQGELNPPFDKDTKEYTVAVKDTINTIRINADPVTGATRTGHGNKVLQMGENIFEIEVTSEDGSTKEIYKIKVFRGDVAEPSATIKNLVLNHISLELDPEFNSDITSYTVTVGKDISKLDIKTELEDPLAVVEINGNEDFQIGENLVTVVVTASDESETKTYEIKVIKTEDEESSEIDDESTDKKDDKDNKKNNILLIVIIVVVILVIVFGLTFFLFRKKDKKEDERLPLKKRNKPTEDKDDYIDKKEIEKEPVVAPRHAASEDIDETKSVTGILKGELFDEDDNKTMRFDSALIKKYEFSDDEENDKTKEFDFKNLE